MYESGCLVMFYCGCVRDRGAASRVDPAMHGSVGESLSVDSASAVVLVIVIVSRVNAVLAHFRFFHHHYDISVV